MAVLQMEHIQLCAMRRDRKRVMELLQRRGVVELRDIEVADEVFEKADTVQQRQLFGKMAGTAARAAEIVNRYAPQAKAGIAFLQGRTAMTLAENEAFEGRRDEVYKAASQVLSWEREIGDAKAEILRSEAQEEALKPWLELPVPQVFAGTKKTAVFIGSLEGSLSEGEILARLAEAEPGLEKLHVELVSQLPEQTNFILIVLKPDAALAEDALRRIGFARPAGASHRVPRDKQKRLQEKRREAEALIERNTALIVEAGPRIEDFRKLEDHMNVRSEKYEALALLANSRHTFVLDGWVPQKEAPALTEELNRNFDLAVSTWEAEASNDVPVKLENKWFPRPLEGVLESYSMPGVGEIDPVAVMAPFYYVMFGLMFSDAGYGLIMAGVCGFCLWKFKNMEPNWKNNLWMFFWCGVSTVFWGIIFSSYFGDVVNAISGTFFGHEVGIPPVWFSPLEEPMKLLMFCLLLGIIHLSVGYVMKGVTNWKNGDKMGVLYDAVCPVLLLYPLVVMLLGTDIIYGMVPELKIDLPPMVSNVCLAIVAASAVVIIFTSGRPSNSWVKRILKGLYGLYNVLSGWVSDILSYSRLLALGLATGVIASVMNQLGTMAGGGILGAVLFLVVFAVGQTLNFGINVLGAYVHSNRLEYVEFFGKFYEGGGRKFAPLGNHSKYFKIQED